MSYLLRRAPRALPTARAFSTATPRSSFAKITIVGRLADTPELQATSTGQEILRYAVGTSSGPRDNQKTSWFRVTSFLPEGPQRDFIASLDKGYVEFSFWRALELGEELGWPWGRAVRKPTRGLR
jgi:hypothetical protein